jgi:hypothetical protein
MSYNEACALGFCRGFDEWERLMGVRLFGAKAASSNFDQRDFMFRGCTRAARGIARVREIS